MGITSSSCEGYCNHGCQPYLVHFDTVSTGSCRKGILHCHSIVQAAIFASVSSQAKDCFSSDDVAAYVLTRWLPPGEFSCQALAETLQELGKAVSVEQVKGISTSEIIDFLVTVSGSSIDWTVVL